MFSLISGTKLQLTRAIQTSAAKQSGFSKWAFNSAGYNKYGLLTDDLLQDMDPDVVEALRRLPQKLQDERNYRMLRAVQLNIQKSILPKDQWTKYEDVCLNCLFKSLFKMIFRTCIICGRIWRKWKLSVRKRKNGKLHTK